MGGVGRECRKSERKLVVTGGTEDGVWKPLLEDVSTVDVNE